MQTSPGHLTFCTNIFPGETWETHFDALKENIPLIKAALSPGSPFAVGLRLSDAASLQLGKEDTLKEFQRWLRQQDCYVLSINGFPYGNFHRSRVKGRVHFPDWTTGDRLQYTLRLFRILAALLPEDADGGVSTSPLSYKHWFGREQYAAVKEKATRNILEAVCALIGIYKDTGKVMHLDIEPEADGLIESSDEFAEWFRHDLLPLGIAVLHDRLALPEADAVAAVRKHVRLCYDVCHFAVGYEEPEAVIRRLEQEGIQIGRWQLSAALKAKFSGENVHDNKILQELKKFDEPVYLHQVVARHKNGALTRYPDLPEALKDFKMNPATEWRSHFHVPLFIDKYGLLESTREDVLKAIALQKEKAWCNIMETETYTWDVLPGDLKLPLAESIIREMKWADSFTSDQG